jgi:hypothetical protein
MKNADMTEGRGPMVIDKCFSEQSFAEKYIDIQPGVMGVRHKWSKGDNGGNWEVRPVEVIDYNIVNATQQRKLLIREALAKLSNEEIKALNIKLKGE